MISAFKIGATLELNSNVAKSLGLIAEQFEKFDRQVKSAQTLLGEFAASLDKIASRGHSAGAGLVQFAEAAQKIGRDGAGIQKLAEGLAKVEAVSRGLGGLQSFGKTMAALGGESKGAASLAGALKKLEGVKLEVSGLDAYSSAVGRLAAHEPAISRLAKSMMDLGRTRMAAGSAALAGGTNAVERELAERGNDRAMRGQSLAIQKERLHHHDLGVTAMAAGGAGRSTLHLVSDAASKSFELEHMRQQLLSDKRISIEQANSAIKVAKDSSVAVPGTSISHNMKALTDLYTITGDFEEAKKFTPKFAELSAVLQVLDRRKGGTGDSGFAAEKASELLGEMVTERDDGHGHTIREVDGSKLVRSIDAMTRVAVRTNLRVKPEDYLAVAKTGEIPGMRWTDEFKYEQLPSIMMAMGATRAGTAATSLSQVMIGGRLMDKYRGELSNVGLATPETFSMEKDPVTGRKKKVRHGGDLYDMDVLMKNPLQYVMAAQTRMEEKGIHGGDDQIAAIERTAQRSTIGRFLAIMIKDMPAILKEQQGIQNTGGRDGQSLFQHFAENDPTAKVQQFHAAWENFLTVLGGSLMDPAIKTLESVTKVLNTLTKMAEDHPVWAKAIAEAIGAFGLVAVAVGAVSTALFVASPMLRLFSIRVTEAGAAASAAAAAAGGGGAAKTVMRTAATGLTFGAGLLAGGAALATGGILAVGSAYETPETMSALDKIHRQNRANGLTLSDGFDVSGRPVAPSAPMTRPQTNGDPINVRITNPGDLVHGVSGGLSNGLNRPPSGITGHDPSLDGLGAMNGTN